jgi:autotransporter-associated beta strand protein
MKINSKHIWNHWWIVTAGLFLANWAHAASMVIDSLSGPVTQNEITQFKAYMATQIPPPTPFGIYSGTNGDHNEWADGNGGNALEAMGLMYEISGDTAILTNLVGWTDYCVSQRNDLMSATNGGQRVMWTGKIDKVWVPNETNSASAGYAGGENGDTKAHIAYCALLILQRPSLWNVTIPDGNPHGYGVTYYQRATNYVHKCDEGHDEYDYIFYTSTNTIRNPNNWPSGFHTMEANNIQMMLLGYLERLAQCHEILGDDPARVARYDTIVKTAAAECINGMAGYHPGTTNGYPVYAWGYYPWSVYSANMESVGHAAYDMVGVYRAFNRSNYGFLKSTVAPFANAEVYVMNVATNTFSGNVNGSGTTQNYMQAQWLLLSDWNPAVYTITAEADYASGRYKSTTLMDATILWMKNRRYQQFSLTPTPASQTIGVGGATNFTVAVAPLAGFTNAVGLTVSGLPTGATGNFSASPVSLAVLNSAATNVTLSITTSGSTPAGTYSLTITGTNGAVTQTTNVTLVVGDFSLSASPPSQTVSAGIGTTYTITVATNGGYSGSVSFGIAGLPANVTASYNPTSLNGAGSSTLTVNTASNTSSGNYTLTIYGTNGTVVANAPANLTVVGATPVWTGGSGSDSYWSDAANWGGNGLTTGAPLIFSGTARLNNTNDTAAATTYSNIVFNPGAGAFTLIGNSVAIGGNITNNSGNAQAIDLGLNFSSSFTLDGASSPLMLGGGMTNHVGATGATSVVLTGSGQLADLFNSAISPGGTNVLLVNDPAANWTLLDNASSASVTAPWLFEVNNGTFNYGTALSAPTLSGTTVHNGPSDNQVGSVSGATGTFNMVNGTLTTAARFNTATAANATGIINQTGGTWNMGEQFQGANGSNPGEVSLVTVSGGTMNIGGGGGPFYVASRGTGTLTISGTGVVNCGRLDISRNANGNSVSSVGTVNLSGGTLMVMSVTNISANFQTNGSPTATFNFDGGTLVAKAGATAGFFQGCTATPVTPITAIVQEGGAVIDDGGQSINILEPLQHDSTLGSDLDGGLTKMDTGTLTLTAVSTYNGDTVVSAGTLALSGVASISESDSIALGASATLDASVSTGGTLTLAAGQSLTGSGTVKGNVMVANGATLAPGGSLSTLTFNNNATLSGGSTTVFEVSKLPTTNDFAQVAGNLALGGTIVITNVGAMPYAAGDSFRLFSAGSYSGAFTNIQPTIPDVNLAWNTNGLGTGVLGIVSSSTPPPGISAISFDGTNVMLSATNGVSGWACYVLNSTNLSLPIAQWQCIATNNFDQNGNVNFTNPPATSSGQQFFILQLF